MLGTVSILCIIVCCIANHLLLLTWDAEVKDRCNYNCAAVFLCINVSLSLLSKLLYILNRGCGFATVLFVSCAIYNNQWKLCLNFDTLTVP